LSGTPAEAAIYDLTVRVKDGEENTDSKLLRLSVYPHDGLSVTTRVLPAAVYGKDYSAQLEVSGGIPPYVFTLRRGSSLPLGLELDTSGALAGTPSKKGTYSFVIDAIDGNNLQGSAAYTMTILGAEALAPSHDDFTVKEYESEKRILLEFSLSGDFDNAEILDVEALTSPDSTIAGSSSTVRKEQNGYRINLTLHVADYALNNGGWEALLEQLTLDGITVKFQDASGEEIRFEKGLLVRELKKEEEPAPVSDKKDSGGGGCNAGLGELLSLLALIPIFAARKQ
jgi:Synergist-CTERM protein sorting domain-containing protein